MRGLPDPRLPLGMGVPGLWGPVAHEGLERCPAALTASTGKAAGSSITGAGPGLKAAIRASACKINLCAEHVNKQRGSAAASLVHCVAKLSRAAPAEPRDIPVPPPCCSVSWSCPGELYRGPGRASALEFVCSLPKERLSSPFLFPFITISHA